MEPPRPRARRRLTHEAMAPKIDAADISELSLERLTELFEQELGQTGYLPDGICQVDPRNGDRVIYNSARAGRPHDNQPGADTVEQEGDQPARRCIVCDNMVTRTVDIAELSEGFTFINKNLFPILYPLSGQKSEASDPLDDSSGVDGGASHGFHFLQWTSSYHQRDWHNMPRADLLVVTRRLAALERTLLTTCGAQMPDNSAWGDETGSRGHVGLVKNYSHLVGGSIAHGHQQIALSNNIPRRMADNLRFEQRHGESYARFMLRQNPARLTVRDLGAALLVVPYFMRRPYDMQLIMRDTSRRYLFQLSDRELTAVALGWRDAIRAMRAIMPTLGREVAYNVVTHNGPGAGLYFEFLPYTQEMGGYEHLGLYMCQADPAEVARRLRASLTTPTAPPPCAAPRGSAPR